MRYIKETTSKAATTKFVSKNPNSWKISNEKFHLCESKISLDEIMKSITSQTNYKSSGNDAFTAEFYKDFSYELAAVHLVYMKEAWHHECYF